MSISSKVLEYTAQIQQLLDKINAEVAVGDFKTPTAEASQSPESSLFSPEYKEMVKGILNLAPGLSEIQLKTLVDVEKTKAAGLLTLEACLHLVASSLGFEIDGTEVKKSLPAVENMAPVKSELQDSHLPIPTFDVSFDDLNSTFVISRISEEDVRTIIGELALQLLEAKKLHIELQSMIVGTKQSERSQVANILSQSE